MSAKTLEHHPDLYFKDGDISLSALRTGSTTECWVFRVDKVYLLRNSPIFADMLSLPEPSVKEGVRVEINEIYEGVPMVWLHDQAEAVADLLYMFYYPLTLNLQRWDPYLPIEHIKLLRIAKKYEVTTVLDTILDHFKEDWPSPQSLDQWHRRERDAGQAFITICDKNRDNSTGSVLIFDDYFPEPASAIRLAREFDIPSIFPAAFYQLSCIPADIEWDEARSSGLGIWEIAETRGSIHLREGGLSARWKMLSAADLRRLATGKARVRSAVKDFDVQALQSFKTRPCMYPKPSTPGCLAKRASLVEEWRQELLHDPIDLLSLFRCLLEEVKDDAMCWECANELINDIDMRELRFWQSLPELFDLKLE